MKLPPYPSYKASGVEWLGDVPTHWDAYPLKRRCLIVNGGTPSSGEEAYWDGGIAWITPEDLGKNPAKVISETRRTLSPEGLENCGARLVSRNSVVLSTRAPIGHVAVTSLEACTNQGCRALVPGGARANADFLYYSLIASRVVLQAAGKGTTFMELSAGNLGLHALPFPPEAEQRSIADFLDRETAKIDALIAKKRTLIERLQEKRTALISRTVTRGLPPAAARAAGLDPNPKFKPSGIDWLGDIPKHWHSKPLKHVTDFVNGMAFKPEDWSQEGTPIIRIENLNGGSDFNCFEGDVPAKFHVQKGDLLFGWSGNRGTSFGPFLWWREGLHYLNQHIFRLTDLKCEKGWLYWCLKAVTKTIEDEAHGIIGMVHVTRGKLGGVHVPVLPPSEQKAIAAYLDEATAHLDGLVEKATAAVERLQEYRIAVITAAVTGKVDVRSLVS